MFYRVVLLRDLVNKHYLKILDAINNQYRYDILYINSIYSKILFVENFLRMKTIF